MFKGKDEPISKRGNSRSPSSKKEIMVCRRYVERMQYCMGEGEAQHKCGGGGVVGGGGWT